MELKHFSHHHSLGFHQVPQGSQTLCSACKSPGSGPFYVCWQCNYFLHDHCFRATRSLKHPSHPLHPLTLVPFPTYPSASFFCNSCKLGGDGFSYSCSQCEYDIHLHCALMPNSAQSLNSQPQNLHIRPQSAIHPPLQLQNTPAYPPNPPLGYPQPTSTPQSLVPPGNGPTNPPVQTNNPQSQLQIIMNHFIHSHPLKQVEIQQKNGTICSACEWEISGSAYYCTKPHCSFKIDKACFDSPREIQHKSHPRHTLTLLTAPPNGKAFDCYACWRSCRTFAYTCPTCSHNLHIDCISWSETLIRPDHKHPFTLYYSATESTQEASSTCAVCEAPINDKAWRYYCCECTIMIHPSCMGKEMKQQSVSVEKTEDMNEQLLSMQVQKMNLDLQMEMTRVHAQMIASIGSCVSNLI